MLVGKNVRIRAIEKTDMDAHLAHKESFIEGMEVLIKDKSKLIQ